MPKSAKLAGFFQGHFIRFWNRGQAGNGVCELFCALGGARLPKCLSELDKLYDVCKDAGNNADWPPSRWDGAGMFSGRIFVIVGNTYTGGGHTLDQRLGGGIWLRERATGAAVTGAIVALCGAGILAFNG